MIYRRGQKVLVQGITGKQGTFWTEKMMECGAEVVGGVNPKRAGEKHLGLPVFKSAVDAAKERPCDVSVIFIPPLMAKDAIIDAIAEGRRPSAMTDDQRAVYDFASELFRDKTVSDAAFQAVAGRFGEQGVIDLIAAVGYYSIVSMVLNVDRYPLPDGEEPPLPPLP